MDGAYTALGPHGVPVFNATFQAGPPPIVAGIGVPADGAVTIAIASDRQDGAMPGGSHLMNWYGFGTEVRIDVAFTEADGGPPIDPETVTLRLRTPDGEIADLTDALIRDGAGLYHHTVVVDREGLWTYLWLGEGNVSASTPKGGFEVGPAAP